MDIKADICALRHHKTTESLCEQVQSCLYFKYFRILFFPSLFMLKQGSFYCRCLKVLTVNEEHSFKGRTEIIQYMQISNRLPDSSWSLKLAPDYQQQWECKYQGSSYFWIYKIPPSSHDFFQSVLKDLRMTNIGVPPGLQQPERRDKTQKRQNTFHILITT